MQSPLPSRICVEARRPTRTALAPCNLPRPSLARIPDQIIEQVREAHDIVDVVGRAVQLKRAGAGYKGLCPFHDEKTPSFTVHPGRQTYKCFGCNKGGNVLTFVMETQGLSFPESVRQLAEERGIQVPDSAAHDPQMDQRVEALRNALRCAHRFFVESLASAEGAEARAYLRKRGYDEDAVKEFGLGYAPDSWDRLRLAAQKAGVSERALDDAAKHTHADREHLSPPAVSVHHGPVCGRAVLIVVGEKFQREIVFVDIGDPDPGCIECLAGTLDSRQGQGGLCTGLKGE